MSYESYFKANRKLWNTRSPLHVQSSFYDVASFQSGRSSLCGIELAEMGSVRDRSILHLQCHFGLDSLSLAREGASVTGVDFSETAIETAESLARKIEVPARFLCCNVFDLPDHLEDQFDIVFTSFGVVGWLPDINRWAEVVNHFLKPGGFFYLLEFHKFYYQFNEKGKLTYDYFYSNQPDEEILSRTYADGLEHEPLKEYWWNHTISDIVMSLVNQRLQISIFNEFPYSVYKLDDQMVEVSPGKWINQHLGNRIAYMFSLKAEKSHTDA